MSGENKFPDSGNDPIDADFEPAAPAPDFVKVDKGRTTSPGWLALGVTGIVASVVGGGIGALTSGGGAYAPQSLVAQVQTVAEGQGAIERQITAIQDDVRKAETRLIRQIETAPGGQGDVDALASLTSQMNAIAAQLDALEADAYEREDTGGTDLDRVLARIEALETLDADEVASPRVANRVIKSVQRRIEELEADIATRNDTLAALDARLEAAETALEAGAGATESGGVREETAALRAELSGLRETVAALGAARADAGASAEDNQRLTRLVEELRAKDSVNRALLQESGIGQTAVFSMLSIEAAARDGRGFQSAFLKLQEAMPTNASVAKLKPLAVRGAPTMVALQADFEIARAAAAVIAAQASSTDQDSWGWVRRTLGEAVVVRRTGEQTVDSPASGFDAIMNMAAQKLAARDMAGAISAVGQLDAPLRAPFADWLAGARDRQTLEDGLDDLRLTLLDAGR